MCSRLTRQFKRQLKKQWIYGLQGRKFRKSVRSDQHVLVVWMKNVKKTQFHIFDYHINQIFIMSYYWIVSRNIEHLILHNFAWQYFWSTHQDVTIDGNYNDTFHLLSYLLIFLPYFTQCHRKVTQCFYLQFETSDFVYKQNFEMNFQKAKSVKALKQLHTQV